MVYFDPQFLDIRAYLIAYLIISFFGLCIGSFLNVCIYRTPRNESLIKRNSHCTTCGAKIRWFDLVPVFSWLFLKGKCRNCGEKISARYPLVESLNWIAYLLVLTFTNFMDSPVQSVITALFFSVLIVIAFIDYDTMEIYNCHLIFIGILGIVSFIFSGRFDITLKERIIGALCISVPFFIIGELCGMIIKKRSGEKIRGIELGDTFLMLCSGFLIGTRRIAASAFIGIVIAAVFGIILKYVFKKDSKMPFGPYLAVGLMIGTLWGNSLADWYISLILG